MIDKSELKPIKIDDLIRLGRDNDGGYIIPKIILEKCDGLLSFGINKDWSFEKDFSNYDKILNVHCYDHTLNFLSFSSGKLSVLSFFQISIFSSAFNNGRNMKIVKKPKKFLKLFNFICYVNIVFFLGTREINFFN